MDFKVKYLVFLLLGIMLLMMGASMPGKKAGTLRRVVIDAGHGGHDPGTLGKHTREKDVALAVALRLGRYIQENFPEVEVIYTRKTDVFVELYRRAQIANESKADLFISVHCNGTKAPQAKGTETWVMGLHKSKENLEVAKTENASILMEDNLAKYDGFDPNSPEANIIFSLYQNVYLDKSLDMASRVQKYFRVRMNATDRGVKQAGFWVLYKTAMPGILVEVGFLSNPEDEALLSSEQGQDQVAASIYHAFKEFKEETDGLSYATTRVPKDQVKDTPNPEVVQQPIQKPEPAKDADPTNGKQTGNAPLYPAKTTSDAKPASPVSSNQYVFKVQIASSDKELKEGNPLFKGVKGVRSYKHKGLFKYVVGAESGLQQALELQKKMQSKGFKDAFIVVFKNGERVSEDEAKALIPKQ